MMLLNKVAALLWASTVVAQGETGPNNSTDNDNVETQGEIMIHTVTVALLPFAFSPNSLLANPGDKVMFKFWPGNHSVIQSLYGWPCIPTEAVNGHEGFFSGSMPTPDSEHPLVWNLTINDTEPVFYYCGAPGSCINYGMLGVINPNNETNLTAQIALAKAAKYEIGPGDPLPAGAEASVAALASKYTAEPTASSSAHNKHGSSGLSSGAIAGIVVGSVVALALVGALLFWIGRNRGQVKTLRETLHQKHENRRQYHGPPEMQVDGITYVPAADPRASTNQNSLLPPYQYQPESRSKSPESVSVYGSPRLNSGGLPQFSPELRSPTRYSEIGETTYFAPTPRHELHAQPIVRENQEDVVDDNTRYA